MKLENDQLLDIYRRVSREPLIGRHIKARPFSGESFLTPEEEDKVVEALEELRINYNLRQWRVCSLICESLSDKFRTIANQEQK
jgi:hypothetical protein